MKTVNTYKQAIKTKYLSPTNHKGTRVKAQADAGSVIVEWDHALESSENHAAAAQMLCQKYGWNKQGKKSYKLIQGGIDNGNYVFVLVEAK